MSVKRRKANVNKLQILAVLSVSLVNLVNGFLSGYTSPAAESMKKDLHITDEQYSWVGSLMPLSALFGGLFGGKFMDWLGRRSTIILSDVLFVVCWLLVAVATNIWYVVAGRCIGGFGIGIATLTIPVYLVETTPPHRRGTLGLLPSAFGNIGILLCYVLGAWLNWDFLAWCGLAIPIPILVFLILIPESPRWYMERGRVETAQSSLVWLTHSDEYAMEQSLHELQSNTSSVPKIDLRVHGTLHKYHLKPFSICMALMFFQQMSGVNAVIFYTTTIFRLANTDIPPSISTAIVGSMNFASSLIAVFLIDRLGRKLLLYISASTLIVTLTALGTYFYMNVDDASLRWVPLVAFVVYILGFSLGYGPVPWLMMGEILPLSVRNHAAALITAFNWLMTFVVTKSFATMLQHLRPHGTFWAFAAVEACSMVFLIKWVPETRERTLEEIEQIYGY